MTLPRLILASSSPYRKRQLEGLGIRFDTAIPDIDETPIAGETPERRSERLGRLKAECIANTLPAGEDALVIGSDQVCHLAGRIYRKPGDEPQAFAHLRAFSGHWVSFTTSLALARPGEPTRCTSEVYDIHFRELSDAVIRDYLALDKPFDCAGAIKVEQAGVMLLDDMRGRDINTLYGLPLMALTDQLAAAGYLVIDFK